MFACDSSWPLPLWPFLPVSLSFPPLPWTLMSSSASQTLSRATIVAPVIKGQLRAKHDTSCLTKSPTLGFRSISLPENFRMIAEDTFSSPAQIGCTF